MPTQVISKIGSHPDDDYSTLAAWKAARGGNLIARDTIEIAELRGEIHEGGVGFSYPDDVTDSGHYFEIRAMEGAEFRGDFGNLTGQAVVRGEYAGVTVSCVHVKLRNIFIGNQHNLSYDWRGVYSLGNESQIELVNVGVGDANSASDVFGLCLHYPTYAELRNVVIAGLSGSSNYGIWSYCASACQAYCQDYCQVSCQESCQVSCQDSCQVSCQDWCEQHCQTSCETSCQEYCQSYCQEYCELHCQVACEVSCEGWNQ